MLEKQLDLNDLQPMEKHEIIKFLETLNGNITWNILLREHKDNIKTVLDLLKIVKPRVWIDKSLDYEQYLPKHKIYEYYFKILYTDYLLYSPPGLTITLPDLSSYPDKLRKFIELKYDTLKGILETNNFTHTRSENGFIDLSPFSVSFDNLYCDYLELKDPSYPILVKAIKVLCYLLFIGLTIDEIKVVVNKAFINEN